MSYTNGLDKPTDYFNTKLYTGTVSSQSITGVGFQPDWVWIKYRSDIANHHLYDSVRGVQKRLNSNTTNTEATSINNLTSFDSDGFTIGTDNDINESGQTYASWNWLAGGTASSNTDGSITSTVSANTTSGFSIVSYTGNATAGATIGHGLGVEPSMIIFKSRNATHSWITYHKSLGTGNYVYLNLANASSSDTAWCTPSSSTFELNQVFNATNSSGTDYIAYCFSEKKGFSKFGSYTGNGNADGTFVYTGFKPAMIIRKVSSTTGGWLIHDSTRTPFNGLNSNTNGLRPNSSEAEFDFFDIDYLSNGFKIRTAEANHNQSGQTFIYIAFASSPFVTSTGIPTCAR
jgi:hypothetical protein